MERLRVNDEVLISALSIVEVLSEDTVPLCRHKAQHQENTPPPRKGVYPAGASGVGGGGNNPFDSPSQRTPRSQKGYSSGSRRSSHTFQERAALASIHLDTTPNIIGTKTTVRAASHASTNNNV